MIEKNFFSGITDLLSIILFGSKAREEEDQFSDVDIFLLVEDVCQKKMQDIITVVEKELPFENIGISIYKKSIYNKMLQEGSIFLWHLKLEGKIIYKKSNINLYRDLKPFKKFDDNLNIYKNIYENTKNSLKKNGVNIFDLSQLFFVCRNLCLLTCFKLDKPTFGRTSVYFKLSEYIGLLPLKVENYSFLSKCRLNYTRGTGLEFEYPDNKNLLVILKQIESLLKVCEEIIKNGGAYSEHR
ncbi:nucleotidyltransferase domain-containing protein [Bacillus velezensis]|uniref:nucleotidyltransferase domain-containing protein n=1 Tax=Bacillus velezensis TaxID=492670 RepID=UPI0003B0EBF1|nr:MULTISPECIES: nucleotidyltransferase domain-containing protein [Bacillus]AIU83887.1 hypothetical protein NG74_03886 [Bacillus velezensis]ASK60415.1 nucleotidyltransferase domain-containing protein [Bacillus velezensis]ATD75087.1 hypothetical protein CLI98_01782 [Bacillus velezensis]ATV24785.1 nucleotidyltransferase domain-containing protein [Bacillus sp. Lzh-5]MVZ94186.1 nucleotidyltransferase domain-containing protein [Bacillus velezensis]